MGWTEGCPVDEPDFGTPHSSAVWDYLRSMEMRLPSPSPEASREWSQWGRKPGKRETDRLWVGALVASGCSKWLRVWAETRTPRLWKHPINRLKVWVPQENSRPSVNWKYQWLWLVGFVHPTTETLLVDAFLNKLTCLVGTNFLQHLRDWAKAVVLAVDQAAFHTVKRYECRREFIYCLCAPIPRLQPAERLWPLTNEAIANAVSTNLDELSEAHCLESCWWRDLIKRLKLLLVGRGGWLVWLINRISY